jgi:hypothetical protein
VHLVDREALRIYLSRLADDGLLVFHVSNSRFDLAPVLAALADDAALDAVERDDVATPARLRTGVMSSRWIVMSRKGRLPPALAGDPRWGALERDPALPLWTDDYSSLVRIMAR